MKNKTQIWTKLGALTIIALATSCFPNEFDDNGLTEESLDASFTITPVTGSPNNFTLKANASNFIAQRWELGDGSPAYDGGAEEEIFLPDAGSYTVKHTAVGRGGFQEMESLPLTVAVSDPAAGNLVLGGKMDTDDDANWQFETYSAGVTVALADGKMVWTGGSWGHAGIYQAIEIEGGKKYKVDMLVSGSGATDTWFEVYVGQAEPVPGVDYSDGGKRLSLNTWTGCGKTAFSGKLTTLSCDPKSDGTFTFEESGTVYLFIRGGGANLGTTGISIDNVELRGAK